MPATKEKTTMKKPAKKKRPEEKNNACKSKLEDRSDPAWP